MTTDEDFFRPGRVRDARPFWDFLHGPDKRDEATPQLFVIERELGYLPDGVWIINWCHVEVTHGCEAPTYDGDHANCGMFYLVDPDLVIERESP